MHAHHADPPAFTGAERSTGVARAVALTMMADASLHPKELDSLDAMNLYAKLGLTRDQLLTTASERFADAMLDMRERDRSTLRDDVLVDRVLGDVRGPDARALAYRVSVALLPADGRLSEGERAVPQRMLDQRQLLRPTVEGVLG